MNKTSTKIEGNLGIPPYTYVTTVMSVELRMYVLVHCARTSLVRLNSLSCGGGVGGKGTGCLDC